MLTLRRILIWDNTYTDKDKPSFYSSYHHCIPASRATVIFVPGWGKLCNFMTSRFIRCSDAHGHCSRNQLTLAFNYDDGPSCSMWIFLAASGLCGTTFLPLLNSFFNERRRMPGDLSDCPLGENACWSSLENSLGEEELSTLRGMSMVILSRVLPDVDVVPRSKKAEFDMEETLFWVGQKSMLVG